MDFFNFHPEGEFAAGGFLTILLRSYTLGYWADVGIDDHGGLFALKAQPYSMLQVWSLAILSWFTEYLVWILKSLIVVLA